MVGSQQPSQRLISTFKGRTSDCVLLYHDMEEFFGCGAIQTKWLAVSMTKQPVVKLGKLTEALRGSEKAAANGQRYLVWSVSLIPCSGVRRPDLHNGDLDFLATNTKGHNCSTLDMIDEGPQGICRRRHSMGISRQRK